ncbi:MAG TPA: TMEM43 family protein [Mesorhizobium sp.]|jgi:hypothetical protein|nr:TMEM43 family protein [Mesorhizobium sp.]
MSDTFREVTRTSWGGRIARSFGGLIVGLLLVVLVPIGLFWNEGRAVTTERSLTEGAAAVVSVASEAVDPANEGKLVHLSGDIRTGETLADGDFGISAQGVRLVRQVEMYQWREEQESETETQLGGGEETVTTYTYSRGWSDEPIDSADFRQPGGHANPSMEIRGRSFQVEQATLGAFTLDKQVLDVVGGEERLEVKREQIEAINQALGGSRSALVSDGRIFLGRDPAAPQVGDYRIAYELVPLGPASLIAKQAGSGFDAYQTAAGDALLMVERGTVSAEKMFADAQTMNVIVTWVLRVVGVVVLAIGFGLVLAPLGVVADVVPFVGSLVRFGTGLAAMLLAVLTGTTTIALAWMWHRPVFALGVLAVGVAVAALIAALGRRRAGKSGGAKPDAAAWGRTAGPSPA